MAVKRSNESLTPAQRLAVGGYRSYGLGVSMLSNPDETARMHGADVRTHPNLIIATAKDMMISGIGNVVRYSDPDIVDSKAPKPNPLRSLERRFSDLAANMGMAVDRAFESNDFVAKMQELSPAFVVVQPRPMCVEGVYKNICHSRRGNLRVESLMMGIPLDPRFGEELAGSSVERFVEEDAGELPDLERLQAEEMQWVDEVIGDPANPAFPNPN